MKVGDLIRIRSSFEKEKDMDLIGLYLGEAMKWNSNFGVRVEKVFVEGDVLQLHGDDWVLEVINESR